jgi:hypothetical protein
VTGETVHAGCSVGKGVCEVDAVDEEEGVTVPVPVRLGDGVPVPEYDGVVVGGGVGALVEDGVPLCVAVWLGDGVPVPVWEAVSVDETDGFGVCVGVDVREGVGVLGGVTEGVAVGVPEGEPVWLVV